MYRCLVLVFAALLLSSCAVQEEVRPVALPPLPAPPPQQIVSNTEPLGPPAPPPVVTRDVLYCKEMTEEVFNRCGPDVRLSMRPVFFDMDGDGRVEMVVGTRNDGLLLYRNDGGDRQPVWREVTDYFRGVGKMPFASPAVGDIDNDGIPELLVGTGGFSSDSGRVLAFRNAGTHASSRWERIDMPEIRVGTDAAPVLFGQEGQLDLIVGNAAGALSLFRNGSRDGRVVFHQDREFMKGVRFGMYIVPAAVSAGNKTVVIVGNDLGKLQMLEGQPGGGWRRSTLHIRVPAFATPSFIHNGLPGIRDLVVADGSGQLHYFKNSTGGYRQWAEDPLFFSGRILSGPACTPAYAEVDGRPVLVVGNIHGELRLLEYTGQPGGLPWEERPDFFRGVKLSGYSRGVLTLWKGEPLLITGQHDGILRAFRNGGAAGRPAWTEVQGFFRGLPLLMHAAPVVFDMDGDGQWELVVGDDKGRVRGYRYRQGVDNMTAWEPLSAFEGVSVGRFAVPSLYRDGATIHLLVGEQDGRIVTFSAKADGTEPMVFGRGEDLDGIRVKNHSAPSAAFSNGRLELTVGDYDGNLRQYACSMKSVVVPRN